MSAVLAELGISAIDIGATGLLAVVLLMIFTARLVPKRYYEEAVSRVEEERKAKENWRAAAQELLRQNTLLLQKDDVSLSTLRAIRSSVDEGRDTP